MEGERWGYEKEERESSKIKIHFLSLFVLNTEPFINIWMEHFIHKSDRWRLIGVLHG